MVLPDGRRIEVDAPCLVLTAAGATRVAEPTQKLPKLHLKIDGENHEVSLPPMPLAGTAAMLKLDDWEIEQMIGLQKDARGHRS